MDCFSKRGPGGLRAACKTCCYAVEKERTPENKICSFCKVLKPRSDFNRRGDRHNAVISHCKACQLEKHRKYMESPEAKEADRRTHNFAYANDPGYRAKVKERSRKDAPAKRDAKLKRVYGLTSVQWDAILLSQGGVCAICQGAQSKGRKSFCTDHDHATGEIRGILCHPCNVAIGLLRDSVDLVFAAGRYLEKHKKA